LIADNKMSNKFIKGFKGYRWIKNYILCVCERERDTFQYN